MRCLGLLSLLAACGAPTQRADAGSPDAAPRPFVAGVKFLDETPTAIAFTPNDELIVSTTTTLRRLTNNGDEVWRIPLTSGMIQYAGSRTSVEVSVSGRIAFHQGPEMAIYEADSTVIWSRYLMGLYDMNFGLGDEVFVVHDLGWVKGFSGTTGEWNFSGYGPLTKASGPLAVNSTGSLAYIQFSDTTVSRWDAAGNAIAAWHASMPLTGIVFDASDRLVGLRSGEPVTYERFDVAGAPTAMVSGGVGAGYPDFVLRPGGFFEWRQAFPGDTTGAISINVLDQNAGLVSTIARTNAKGLVAACGNAGHCAAGAANLIVSKADEATWIETFAVP